MIKIKRSGRIHVNKVVVPLLGQCRCNMEPEMSRYFAFLRAVNVGGRTVKMDAVREIFQDLGFDNVSTYIASGNVIFESARLDADAFSTEIETALRAMCGFEVATFVRADGELAELVNRQVFGEQELAVAAAYNVAFLRRALTADETAKVAALTTEIDRFAVEGREVYWLCRKNQSQSTFSNQVLEKTIKTSSTLRGMATLQKLVGLYGG